MSEPLILTKNYVNADDAITVSHGDGSKGYLYDRDKDSKWLTSGANDDATEVSIIVEFYEGTEAVERTIDRVLLINHNLKNWELEYWDGSAWQPLTSETTDGADVTFKSFSEQTTEKVRLLCTETQIADAEKFVGEFIVAALAVDPARDMEDYEVRFRERTNEMVMGDGSIHRTVTRWAQNRLQRYEARVRFSYIADAAREEFRALRDAGEAFLWYPESTTRPDEIWFVFWTSPYRERYVSSYKGAGIEIDLELKEV